MKGKELRNKIIKARVTEKEREEIKKKACTYGYKNVSKYLIDAVLFENITIVDTKGQDLVYKAYANYTKEIKKIRKALVDIKENTVILNEQDSNLLRKSIFAVFENQRKMMQIINEKLNLEISQKNKKGRI